MLLNVSLSKTSAASGDEGLSYVCIQVKADSLEGFTAADEVVKKKKNLDNEGCYCYVKIYW